MQQLAADLGRAGERHNAHARIVQHRADRQARSGATGSTLTTPAGTPASSSSGISASMVSGVSDAGLSTTGQPAAKRRADLARRHRGGEIPRRHQHGDAGRLVLRNDARAGRGRHVDLADVAHGLFGVPAEELRRIEHFALLNPRAPCRFRCVISLAKRSASRTMSSKALRRISARSRGLRAAQPSNASCAASIASLGVLHARARHGSDLVLGRRVDHVEARAVGGFAPFAADPEVGRNVGEEVVVHGHDAILQLCSERRTVSAMRSTVGSTASSSASAAGSGICGVVMRTGGPSRS